MINKLYINYLIQLFGIVCVLIIGLIILYYITPNNYSIEEYKDSNNKKLYKQIIINPNSTYIIDDPEICDKYLYIDKNINIIISNTIKSNDINYDNKYKIIVNYNSNISFINDSNKKIIINIYFV
jgi:hypothetical protein